MYVTCVCEGLVEFGLGGCSVRVYFSSLVCVRETMILVVVWFFYSLFGWRGR